ncbi:hypothetical protein BGW80DRAFT_1486727 [Lactifluus volemus]|nr:hypothetical protein BGW80DRAFT_1486727 [Lactifluus volemus]
MSCRFRRDNKLQFKKKNLKKTLFQLKFTAKSLNRQAKKAQKDENVEKTRLKRALQQGNNDGARIYASNAIRKKIESLNLLRLAMKGMDKAMETMNLERISLLMDKFEAQFSDLGVQTSYMEVAMGSTTAVSMPQDQVDSPMRQMAEEANIEFQQDLVDKGVLSLAPPERRAVIGVEDSTIADRLRALRPAT